MTDVTRLREIRAERMPLSTQAVWDRQNRILDALIDILAPSAQPDGAAERAGQAHRGDPCRYCGTPHDEVAPGPCPARAPAPVAAPTAGNAIEIAFGTAQAQTERPRDGDDMRNWHWFERGWNAALAARPAVVTEEMVEAAASAYFGVDNWKSFPAPTVTSYREAWRSALTAALAARGPA